MRNSPEKPRLTLVPAPFDIPPAPAIMTRAAVVPVVSIRDRVSDGLIWAAEHLTTYHKPAPDAAADVFDEIGGAQ